MIDILNKWKLNKMQMKWKNWERMNEGIRKTKWQTDTKALHDTQNLVNSHTG